MNTIETIAAIRDSVCAVMRVRKGHADSQSVAQSLPGSTGGNHRAEFVGTGFCIVDDTVVLTALHILNDGDPPLETDEFHVLTAPSNGPFVYPIPVLDIMDHNVDVDFAMLRIKVPKGESFPALTLTASSVPDGSEVVTYGFPLPDVVSVSLTRGGRLLTEGTKLFLKGHANTGIVAAQYEYTGVTHYEFNIPWHYGESGGPIVLKEGAAALSMMQQRRTTNRSHTLVRGPSRGRAFGCWRPNLLAVGATFV